MLAIEIHDLELLALTEKAAEPISGGPGQALIEDRALLENRGLLVGAAAAARARVQPRRLHDRFWFGLSTETLGRPWPRSLTRADLAHAHLEALWRAVGGAGEALNGDAQSVLLAVPGYFTSPDLGLLLGVTRALGIPVDGLVDTAVATASRGYPGARLLHLDLHRHALLATELFQDATLPGLERRRVELYEDVGEDVLANLWARHAASRFIQATRFDPLHAAASEQILYQSLNAWSEALIGEPVIEMSFEHKGRTYVCDLEREALIASAEKVYCTVEDAVRFAAVDGGSLTVVLAPSLARLPGLAERLGGRSGVHVQTAQRGAAARGALRHAGDIRLSDSDNLPFVTTLPLTDLAPAPSMAGASAEESNKKASVSRPTHLLHNGLAYGIDSDPIRRAYQQQSRNGHAHHGQGRVAGHTATENVCLLRDAQGVHIADVSSTWRINGELIVGKALLQIGDRLSHSTERGLEFHLIAVVDGGAEDHGTPS